MKISYQRVIIVAEKIKDLGKTEKCLLQHTLRLNSPSNFSNISCTKSISSSANKTSAS